MHRKPLIEPLRGNLLRASHHGAERRQCPAGHRKYHPHGNDHSDGRKQGKNSEKSRYVGKERSFVIAQTKEQRTAVEIVKMSNDEHPAAIAQPEKSLVVRSDSFTGQRRAAKIRSIEFIVLVENLPIRSQDFEEAIELKADLRMIEIILIQ